MTTNSMPSVAIPSASPDQRGLKGMFSGLLEQNPYFSAGFGLMGLGVAAAALRRISVQAATLARRQLLVNLEITSKDPSYLWFLQWMEMQKTKLPPALSLSARLAARLKSHNLAVETSTSLDDSGSTKTAFNLVPGPGRHYFRYRDAWFQVQRERDSKLMDLNYGLPFETVLITTLSKDRYLFPSLLQEAREMANSTRSGRTVIYTAWATEWRPFGQPRPRRLLQSVVLDKGVKERIVQDVQNFLNRGQWYAQRGIPYRRGYLLHGPPGSGKSSFIQALAGSLSLNIAILNLSERGLTDDKLNHLLANAPEQTILLLEDVDAAFAGRSTGAEPGGISTNVTFSGLLNALDGVAASTSQRILFMTTNHAERLDPALIRPGRVDLKELIGDTTPYQAGQLFHRFYFDSANASEEHTHLLAKQQQQVEDIVQNGVDHNKMISMAALQGLFIQNDANQATQKLPELIIQEQGRIRNTKSVTPSMPS